VGSVVSCCEHNNEPYIPITMQKMSWLAQWQELCCMEWDRWTDYKLLLCVHVRVKNSKQRKHSSYIGWHLIPNRFLHLVTHPRKLYSELQYFTSVFKNHVGRCQGSAQLSLFLPQRPGFSPRSVYVWFEMAKVALQVIWISVIDGVIKLYSQYSDFAMDWMTAHHSPAQGRNIFPSLKGPDWPEHGFYQSLHLMLR
jgi:hypothetical protein